MAAIAAACFSSALLSVASAASDDLAVREPYCPAAQAPVAAFHGELNAGAAKDMKRLAHAAERAADVLTACADKMSTRVIERDRLRVRAADALLIAAVARYRTAQPRNEVTDLNRVLRLVGSLDTAALTSQEHLYQEARLLRRFSVKILGKAQS